METHIQSVDDTLIESLSFKLPNSANFINDRRSVSFFPSGGNSYSPNGVKVIKFMLTGSDWLDPSSLRIQFRLSNQNAQDLKLINPLPSNFFRRLRILAGGQVIEDIDCYNRVYNMIHMMLPAERRCNDFAEGFGVGTSSEEPWASTSADYRDTWEALDSGDLPPWVRRGESRVVMFPLLCGLLNQSKFLPLRFLQGLQIELEVVNNYTDCICTHSVASTSFAAGEGPITATTWLISEAQVKCDVISLDNTLDNEYAKHLLSGKSLPINFSSFVHQVQAVGGTDRPSISMSRAFTRLKSVFVTFYKRPTMYLTATGVATLGESCGDATHLPLKECNFFYHPQYLYPGANVFLNSGSIELRAKGYWCFMEKCEMEAQLQIGSKLFPEMPIRTGAEAFYHLRKTLGSHRPNSTYAVNIPGHSFRSTKFVLAFD